MKITGKEVQIEGNMRNRLFSIHQTRASVDK